MEIQCAACSPERAAFCVENFNTARGAIEDGAESTANNGWQAVTTEPDGSIKLEALEGFSEEAMFGQQLVRSMVIFNLMERQDELGCTLTRELIEQKLTEESQEI